MIPNCIHTSRPLLRHPVMSCGTKQSTDTKCSLCLAMTWWDEITKRVRTVK